jgi:hypothetical protein
MQDLVDAVRSTGATNMLMLGGLKGATSFAEWVRYLPEDPESTYIEFVLREQDPPRIQKVQILCMYFREPLREIHFHVLH